MDRTQPIQLYPELFLQILNEGSSYGQQGFGDFKNMQEVSATDEYLADMALQQDLNFYDTEG